MTLRLLGRVGELDAARLHPPAGQHLRLDDGRRRRCSSAICAPPRRSWRSRGQTPESRPSRRSVAIRTRRSACGAATLATGGPTLRIVLRLLLIALLALAIAPTAASAAVLDIAVQPKSGADFGEATRSAASSPARTARRSPAARWSSRSAPIPYRGGFRKAATATTGLDGRFSLRARVRPQPPGPRAGARVRRSQRRRARLRVPAHRAELQPRAPQRDPHRPDLPDAEERQADRPDAVLRRQGGQAEGAAGSARQDQAGASDGQGQEAGKIIKGRFRASALVRIPNAWGGRFRYASCFPYRTAWAPDSAAPKRYTSRSRRAARELVAATLALPATVAAEHRHDHSSRPLSATSSQSRDVVRGRSRHRPLDAAPACAGMPPSSARRATRRARRRAQRVVPPAGRAWQLDHDRRLGRRSTPGRSAISLAPSRGRGHRLARRSTPASDAGRGSLEPRRARAVVASGASRPVGRVGPAVAADAAASVLRARASARRSCDDRRGVRGGVGEQVRWPRRRPRDRSGRRSHLRDRPARLDRRADRRDRPAASCVGVSQIGARAAVDAVHRRDGCA